MTPELQAKREQIVAHLSRLLWRRRLLRRQIALETGAAIGGAVTCLAFGHGSRSGLATAGLASLAAFLAARDLRSLRRLAGQIAALARIVAAFV